jgi:hypothetical protein
VCGVSEPLQCLACSVLSRFRAQVGIPVVPLASPILGIIWVIHCHPSFYRCFYDLRRKSLSLDLVFAIVLPLVTDVFVIPTMSSLCGNLSRQKFDVDMEQSPLLVVLKIVDSLLSPLSPGSSWISGRDPLLVVLYCNSPVFAKIKNFVFGVNCLIV